jgi:riboflavin kinase/FMN adenylyltransferase
VVTAPRGFRVFRGPDGVAEALGASVVAFGKFDGVHRGHRALLDRALAAGRRLGLPAGAATFERHPHAYLRADRVPAALTGLTDRLRLLRDAGAAFVVLFPTNATVLGLSAEDFARDVLRDRMGVRLVVVGENFRFGRGGSGDVATLRRMVSVTGLDGVEIGMATVDGEVASATGIRAHLARGDMGRAAALLGRPYDVLARLDGGSPTVMWVRAARAVPARGRYRASVRPDRWASGGTTAFVTVCGFHGGRHRLEVTWLDGEAPVTLSGRAVRITFLASGELHGASRTMIQGERHTGGG